jgi:hypothetical protein
MAQATTKPTTKQAAKQANVKRDSETTRPNKSIGTQMDECIENCLASYRACTELVSHCLSMGGEHASEEHITLLTTCAAICQTSATFMIFNSDYHRDSCRLCAKVCITCAEDCERLAEGDEGTDQEMLDCAAICRQSAESCERMSAN